jgi:hypothetical protein
MSAQQNSVPGSRVEEELMLLVLVLDLELHILLH